MKNKNISQQLLDTFNESPLCILSLSSKELFHSNMLSLLFRKFPTFLNDFCGCKVTAPAKITREEKNIDIMVKTSSMTFFIENKVKSIPDKDQLEKNMTKHNGHFILLTLIPPTFNPQKMTKKLRVVTYAELSTMISKISTNDPYLKNLIKDYLDLLTVLEEIKTAVMANSRTETLFLDKTIQAQLAGIRMEDVGQKIRFSSSLRFFQTDCAGLYCDDISTDLYCDDISAGLSHTKGLLSLKTTIGNYKIGIQIQEGVYRRFVESTNKTSVRKIAEELRRKNIWFEGDFTSNKFNKFAEIFLYTKVQVPTHTIDQLCKHAREDGEYLKKNRGKIEKILLRMQET